MKKLLLISSFLVVAISAKAGYAMSGATSVEPYRPHRYFVGYVTGINSTPFGLYHCTLTIPNGNILKEIIVTEKGMNTICLNADSLIPGIYFYSLIVDGRIIDTKRMIVSQ